MSRLAHPGITATWQACRAELACIAGPAGGPVTRHGYSIYGITAEKSQHGTSATLDGRQLVLQPGTGPNRGGDALLASAAVAARPGLAIGVIVSGMLDDGAQGIRAVKRHGGRVLAQDPATARAPGMPSSAIATGCVDLVLPPHRLAAALTALTMAPGGASLLAVPTPHWAGLETNLTPSTPCSLPGGPARHRPAGRLQRVRSQPANRPPPAAGPFRGTCHRTSFEQRILPQATTRPYRRLSPIPLGCITQPRRGRIPRVTT